VAAQDPGRPTATGGDGTPGPRAYRVFTPYCATFARE
jgi:hypothetical protein